MPETTNAFLYCLKGKNPDDTSFIVDNKDFSPDRLKEMNAERIGGYYNVSSKVFETMKKICNEFRKEGIRKEKESEIIALLDNEINIA